MTWPCRGSFAAILCIIAFAGCGGPKFVPVKGTATYHGKPVPNLIINFTPSAGRPSSATTDEHGNFELVSTDKTKGAAVGTHKVSVTPAPRDPIDEIRMANGEPSLDPVRAAIFARFDNHETSPLSVTITKAETNLELKLD